MQRSIILDPLSGLLMLGILLLFSKYDVVDQTLRLYLYKSVETEYTSW